MAGMFSMINGSRSSLHSIACEEAEDPYHQRKYIVLQHSGDGAFEYNMSFKHLFKTEREMNPLLRRSICMLILASLSLLIGVAVIAFSTVRHNTPESVVGITFLALGAVLCLVGFTWHIFNRKNIRIMEMERITKNEKQIEKNRKKAEEIIAHVVTLENPRTHNKWPRLSIERNPPTTMVHGVGETRTIKTSLHRFEGNVDIETPLL